VTLRPLNDPRCPPRGNPEAVSGRADRLRVSEPNDQASIHELKDTAFRLHRGVGGLIEESAHLPIPEADCTPATGCRERIVAFQVNLPAKRDAEGWGEIDLLGVGTDGLPIVIESKRGKSKEPPAFDSSGGLWNRASARVVFPAGGVATIGPTSEADRNRPVAL